MRLNCGCVATRKTSTCAVKVAIQVNGMSKSGIVWENVFSEQLELFWRTICRLMRQFLVCWALIHPYRGDFPCVSGIASAEYEQSPLHGRSLIRSRLHCGACTTRILSATMKSARGCVNGHKLHLLGKFRIEPCNLTITTVLPLLPSHFAASKRST